MIDKAILGCLQRDFLSFTPPQVSRQSSAWPVCGCNERCSGGKNEMLNRIMEIPPSTEQMVQQADRDLIDHYLQRSDWKIKGNSNMAYSLQGLNNYIAGHVSEVYWLNKIYPAEVREAHLSGSLHLHDLGLLCVYCVGWDLQDLLRSGFRGVPGKAASRPTRHFRAILGQIVNFFYTLLRKQLQDLPRALHWFPRLRYIRPPR
jgi:hypothetical protein